ncbi:hypothetical protein EHS16_07440 [Streptococcus anginosus]|nr:hypothetical protein EHS16_07440 [Streptococcus anginosus]
MEEAGYFFKGDGILFNSEEVRFDSRRRSGCIVVFAVWFYVNLCVSVYFFLLEFLETYGIELVQFYFSVIVKLNVFRWLCETVLHEEFLMKLLLFYFIVEVRESFISDGFILSVFGSVNLRFRSGFGDDFMFMLWRSTVKLFDKWEFQWFFFRVSKIRFRYTGDFFRYFRAGGFREVFYPAIFGQSISGRWLRLRKCRLRGVFVILWRRW